MTKVTFSDPQTALAFYEALKQRFSRHDYEALMPSVTETAIEGHLDGFKWLAFRSYFPVQVLISSDGISVFWEFSG